VIETPLAPSPSVPVSRSFDPSSEPSPSSAPEPLLLYSDILRIDVDRLAVREGPSRSSRIVRGDREGTPVGEIRLDAGDFVSVQLGPLVVGDTTWYLVWPAEGAALHSSSVNWSEGPGSAPGWVAATVGRDAYISLFRRPDVGEIEQFLPVGLNASGLGEYRSGPLPRHDLFTVDWAASAPAGSGCTFSMTLLPGDDLAPITVVDTRVKDIAQGPRSGLLSKTPWGRSAGGSWDTFNVAIDSGCSWAIRLAPLPHD
jgi:hypothetical protein